MKIELHIMKFNSDISLKITQIISLNSKKTKHIHFLVLHLSNHITNKQISIRLFLPTSNNKIFRIFDLTFSSVIIVTIQSSLILVKIMGIWCALAAFFKLFIKTVCPKSWFHESKLLFHETTVFKIIFQMKNEKKIFWLLMKFAVQKFNFWSFFRISLIGWNLSW